MSAVQPLPMPPMSESASAVLGALSQMASTLMTEQLNSMFESADDVLFEMVNKARSGEERTAFMNTMRTVRVERPRILKSFQSALGEALRRAEDGPKRTDLDMEDLSSWSLQDDSELEETIAVTNMETKAASLHAKELTELEQRMAQLADVSKGAVSAKALTPARILDAFRVSMRGLQGVDMPSRLVIYKLFDRLVIANLGQIFSDANEMLEARGVKPKAGVARSVQKHQASSGAKHAAQIMSGRYPSSSFAAAMQNHRLTAPAAGAGHGGAVYGGGGAGVPGMGPGYGPGELIAQQNSQLADEMLQVLEAVSNGKPTDSWMPAQNLALVQRMFDDLYTTDLTPLAKPVLGRLQFPVMKYALSDPSFFADPAHPVRALVHDVYQILSTVKGDSTSDFDRLEDLIQSLLKKFEPDPDKLKVQSQDVQAITEQEAEAFLEQQRQRLEQQKKSLQDKIRRIVGQEIRLHIGDRTLPRPVLTLLLSGFGPVLAAHYTAGGTKDAGWAATLNLLERLLGALDRAAAAAEGRAEEEGRVVHDVADMLARAGFTQDRSEQLTDPVVQTLEELAAGAEIRASAAQVTPAAAAQAPEQAAPAPDITPAPRAAAVAPMKRTQTLLRGGDWFRVHCESTKGSRWLKLTNYYPVPDLVVFEDFGGENLMKMRASAFLDDLAAARSAMVDPDPALQEVIKALPPPPDERKPSGESWYKKASSAGPTPVPSAVR